MKNPLYIKYHDEEWCRTKHDDRQLYELFIIELFQAGLSWELILNKRENFRQAYDDFDIDKVVNYDEEKVDSLLRDKGIIRNRSKIEASISNSRVFRSIQIEYGSFDRYIWGFSDDRTIYEDASVTADERSDRISEDLSGRGMKYAGSVSIFSYLQSVGVINSHTKECFCYEEILSESKDVPKVMHKNN